MSVRTCGFKSRPGHTMTEIQIENIISFIIPWILAHGVKIVFILFGAFVLNRIAKKFIEKAVRKAVTSEGRGAEAERKREETLIKIFAGGLKLIVWTIAIVMTLPEFGINIGPILAGAGVLGLAIGVGTQHMVRDFLAGLFVILENQYRVEDYICLDSTCGTIEDITLRKTVLRDLHGTVHHIAHGSVGIVSNYTKKLGIARMDISVAYKEDIDHVMEVINQVGKKMAEESPWKEDTLTAIQASGTGPSNFADSGVEITVSGETKVGTQWGMLREFRRRIKYAFDKEGIEIPFPQRTVWMKKEGK